MNGFLIYGTLEITAVFHLGFRSGLCLFLGNLGALRQRFCKCIHIITFEQLDPVYLGPFQSWLSIYFLSSGEAYICHLCIRLLLPKVASIGLYKQTSVPKGRADILELDSVPGPLQENHVLDLRGWRL